MSKQIETTTVGEFFTWYNGQGWKEDWQTTNAMTVDKVHAQYSGDRGLAVLEFLASHENDTIVISGEFVICAFDITFTLGGKKFMVQAGAFFGTESF